MCSTLVCSTLYYTTLLPKERSARMKEGWEGERERKRRGGRVKEEREGGRDEGR